MHKIIIFTGKLLRIHLLDVLRGVSVFAMVVYHFFWDLGYFKFIELVNVTQGFSLFIAQCIGASFIVISGISFRLASRSLNFRSKYFKRIGILILISSLITLITFFLDKTNFIFFGILHLLATCSVIGLLLLKINRRYVFLVLFIISFLISASNITYDLPGYFSWLGLNKEVPISNDFYPLFPWISFYFFGLWICEPLINYISSKNAGMLVNPHKFNNFYKGLQFLGRNSLTVYILHQPIFFSLFLIFIRISS